MCNPKVKKKIPGDKTMKTGAQRVKPSAESALASCDLSFM